MRKKIPKELSAKGLRVSKLSNIVTSLLYELLYVATLI